MSDLANSEPGGEYALLQGKNLWRGCAPICRVANIGANPSFVIPASMLASQGMLLYQPLTVLKTDSHGSSKVYTALGGNDCTLTSLISGWRPGLFGGIVYKISCLTMPGWMGDRAPFAGSMRSYSVPWKLNEIWKHFKVQVDWSDEETGTLLS